MTGNILSPQNGATFLYKPINDSSFHFSVLFFQSDKTLFTMYHINPPAIWDSVPFGLALPASNLVSGSVINLEFSIIHVLYGNKNFLNDSQTKNIVKKSGVIPYLNPRSWDIAEILLPHQRSCHFQKRFKLKKINVPKSDHC